MDGACNVDKEEQNTETVIKQPNWSKEGKRPIIKNQSNKVEEGIK